MTCVASGDPEPNVYWINVNDGALLKGSVLNFTNITRHDIGQYRCLAENGCGRDSSVRSVEVFCKYEPTPWLFLFYRHETTGVFFFSYRMVLIIFTNK